MLQLNPTLKAHLSLESQVHPGLLRHNSIDPQQLPLLFAWLSEALLHPENDWTLQMEKLPEELADYLLAQGILVNEETCPRHVRLLCPLDLTWPDLLPENFLKTLPPFNRLLLQQFKPNPELEWRPLEKEHPTLPFTQWFDFSQRLLWVKEPFYQLVFPYCPSQAALPWLERLLEQGVIPPDIPEVLFHQLALAQVVIPADAQLQAELSQGICQSAQSALRQQDYVILKHLLNPLQVAAFRDYYRRLEAANYLVTQNIDVSFRQWLHNDLALRFVHHQLLPFIQTLVPEAIKPSYSFASYYQGPGVARHTDRPQCVWNISMMIDPQPESLENWPLCLEKPEGVVGIMLASGDAALYQGRRWPHWRPDLEPGQRVTVALMHFVPQEFEGDLR
ncbi:MAG: hypothetical protein IV090_08400 [Candidatus Sericytochromatia bacterium]|nr:hypothetical protein [Candidatus Sericytochromatia bacterium]